MYMMAETVLVLYGLNAANMTLFRLVFALALFMLVGIGRSVLCYFLFCLVLFVMGRVTMGLLELDGL